MPRQQHKRMIDIASAIVLLILIVLDVAMWRDIFAGAAGPASGIYFLPVAQGESSLLVLPGGVTVLTDAGSDDSIVDDLENIISSNAPPYIDLAIISSPQDDDYGGYQYLLQHYTVGAFMCDGRADNVKSTEWQQLMDVIAAKHIPLITLGAGDRIHYGSAGEIDVLSPDAVFAQSADPDDAGLVQRIIARTFRALLAADIGINVENALLSRGDLAAQILKAPFPGLSMAAGDAFLRAVAPRIIVVEPGKKGTPSQPTKAMLARLASSTNAVIASPKPGSFLLYNK